MLIDLINNALKSDYSKLELIARNRIKNNFTIEHRKILLIKELDL